MKQIFTVITLVALVVSSCKDGSSSSSDKSIPNSEAIEMVQESQALKDEIKTTKKHDNETVELLGSFSISGVTLTGDDNNLLLMGFEGINVWVPVNQGKNCAVLPEKEKILDTEVEISDANGKKHKMRSFPVFKATCTVSYDANTEASTNTNTDPELAAINDRIKNAGGGNNGSDLNYKVTVTNIEWVGDRDYSN